jgi:hypothetical protein
VFVCVCVCERERDGVSGPQIMCFSLWRLYVCVCVKE